MGYIDKKRDNGDCFKKDLNVGWQIGNVKEELVEERRGGSRVTEERERGKGKERKRGRIWCIEEIRDKQGRRSGLLLSW